MNIKLMLALSCVGVCGFTVFPMEKITSSLIAGSLALAIEEPRNSDYLSSESLAWTIDFIPPDKGTPPADATIGAGPVGECSFSGPPLTAMVFSESDIEPGKYRWQWRTEKTLQTYPVFWFYVPENESSLTIRLRLQDAEDAQLLHEEALLFEQEETGAVVGYRLPELSGGLNLNQTYRWILSIECNEDTPPIRVSATMKQVEPTRFEADGVDISSADPRDRINVLASQGLLHDTLTELALLYTSSPAEYQTALDQLLKDAKMDRLTPVEQLYFYD